MIPKIPRLKPELNVKSIKYGKNGSTKLLLKTDFHTKLRLLFQ